MVDETYKIKRAIALNEALIFVGSEVSTYTNCSARGVSSYYSEASSNVYRTSMARVPGRLSIQVPDLVQAIGELGCPIITTNYDLCLEDILAETPVAWNQLCTQSFEDFTKNWTNTILHIYGHINEPDTMVCKQKDYDQIRANTVGRSMLRTLLEGKTLLFVGYRSEIDDPHFSNLLTWILDVMDDKKLFIYKLVKLNPNPQLFCTSDVSFSRQVSEVPYGRVLGDLVSFIESLMSFPSLARDTASKTEMKERIRIKYLHYLIREYGHVNLFGHSNHDMTLPLQSVYVELKFDPTHPSIKAMKTLEIHEEFKRKLSFPGFFNDHEIKQLNKAIIGRNAYNAETIHRDFMMDQWLNVLLSNRTIFTEDEASTIKGKVDGIKQIILKQKNLEEAKQYRIQQVYNEFKHFIVLGHPGSGKTTLSKWVVTSMAKQCLGETNMLFDSDCSGGAKMPILIPIWKYVDQLRENHRGQTSTLLQFICENPTFNATFFTAEERRELTFLVMESLLQGNVLIVFEGLDEVPAHVDRADLMREINALLERRIDYDARSDKLIYANNEQKEINNTKDCTLGNRFIITSRIEGNYFEDINFYLPRLTIENMSAEALRLFCSSYMQCIQDVAVTTGEVIKQYQGEQLYHDITRNKDIFQLAINPQLASVIAAIYYQYEDRLPDNRIDLYEKAITMMIERVVTGHLSCAKNDSEEQFTLNNTMLWSIWQEIAEYLHSRVEGLSEDVLRKIIKHCLLESQKQSTVSCSIDVDGLISKLVDVFKYHAGLLNEFGYNSFRFIHRTFQEYLAAKSIIYDNGIERTENLIYERIKHKTAIPNWRVPLSMAFGILSRSIQKKMLFPSIVTRLLQDEQNSFNRQFSTQLVPFLIIDSFHDLHFATKNTENALVRKLADFLLLDYKNMSGFSRLKEHQALIHSYFSKLKVKHDITLADWIIEKIDKEENLAPCANILFQLKSYRPKFHEIFLQHLHYDSAEWDWPIDSLLRYYSCAFKDDAVETQLKFRTILMQNPILVKRIIQSPDWLCLVVALYGGYTNHRISAAIKEYYEIAQFLQLTETERTPFIFYYQEIWGREDSAYKMAVHLDTNFPTDLWKTKPIFHPHNIYKESCLTDVISKFLHEGKSTEDLLEQLLKQMKHQQLATNEKTEVFMVLVAVGRFDLVNDMVREENETLIRNFENRIAQVMHSLKDPVARCSSQIGEYLMTVYETMKANQSHCSLHYSDYCKIYFSLVAKSGGLPVDAYSLAQVIDDPEDKCALYAESIAFQFTGASNDLQQNIAALLDTCLKSNENDQIIQSFLKISSAVQLYRPVRAYPWPTDTFTFKFSYKNDIPIAFFNCVENMNPNIGFSIPPICDAFLLEGYFHENPELIPLIVLLNFGVMSKDIDMQDIFNQLLPELIHVTDVKECLLEKIQTMCNPYYKSRALYQLAEFYDEKCGALLQESFQLTASIEEPILKFQVLEKIANVFHYKEIKDNVFIEQVIEHLVSTSANIVGLYNRIIAFVRLSFYGSGELRKTYLINSIELLKKMDDNYEKIQIMIQLKPIINLYDEFRIQLETITENLDNETHRYFVKGYYGKILSADGVDADLLNVRANIDQTAEGNSNRRNVTHIPKYTELQALCLLFARLNDMKLVIDHTKGMDQLWINLLNDRNNLTNIERLIVSGLDSEFFLTPQIAIAIDELLERGEEKTISVLFPYIIKPSNEVIPVVQKWFTSSHHQSTKQFAALLLAEARHIFEPAMDALIELLKSNNDQMRYRAQRIFQHPERDVSKPNKRISIIGERTLARILQTKSMRDHLPRVRMYLSTFFSDLLWDDPAVFERLYQTAIRLNGNSPIGTNRVFAFNKILFINEDTWKSIMRSLVLPSSLHYLEDLLQSTMVLAWHDQITPNDWTEFARMLSMTDTGQFREQFYLTQTDIETISLILNEISAFSDIYDETYFEILESKVISTIAIPVQEVLRRNYDQIKHIGRCNFFASRDVNQHLLNTLDNVSINTAMMETLLKWLMQKMASLNVYDDTWFSLLLCDALLSLVSACVQKEDYLYRKITNSSSFDTVTMIKTLQHMVHNHPFFSTRGNAFILLAALDHSDHQIIINVMNALFDENIVKEYTMIGIPLIRLSPTELIEELFKSVDDESSIKAYEILKIFTRYALDEKIDANSKSTIIAYLARAVGQLKSKKPVSYYYTDVRIPFTTTLENELYKAWIKIQGLSGKAQYLTETSK